MVALLAAAALSAAWGAAAIRLGPRIGYVDVPDGALKTHRRAAVPLGGVGVFGAVHLGLVLAGAADGSLLVASAVMLALGLVDDRRGLGTVPRLVVQAAAGLGLGVSMTPGVLEPIGVMLVVVVAVNAVNLFDGLDGMVGGAGLVTAIGLALLAAIRGHGADAGLALAGALAGFLVWNWHQARLFLGDNGSYVTGLFVAYGMVQAAGGRVDGTLLATLPLLGVFVVDLAVTVIRRLMTHRPLAQGDRGHLYDRLHARGLSVPAVALTGAAAQVLFVVSAVTLAG